MVVKTSSRAIFCGELGTNQLGRLAFVVEDAEVVESPNAFVAVTLATTVCALLRENGGARRTVIGIVQDLAATIFEY